MPVFISELKGSLDKIITDTWRAAGTVENKPYEYRVPCPSCERGNCGYDDLRTDYLRGKVGRPAKAADAATTRSRSCWRASPRHELTPEMRTHMRAATNEPPRITITKVPDRYSGC
jgi:hypothetical protein